MELCLITSSQYDDEILAYNIYIDSIVYYIIKRREYEDSLEYGISKLLNQPHIRTQL